MISNYGDVRVELPTADGEIAKFNALELEQVMHQLPTYPLTEAWQDLNKAYQSENKTSDSLPPIDDQLEGRRVDIILGQKYRRFFPKLIFEKADGLAIY